MKNLIKFSVVGMIAISLAACAVPPGHRYPPGNSAYGHAQGKGPHKKSSVELYGTVDAGMGYKHQKIKRD